jgi:hypothetical protein
MPREWHPLRFSVSEDGRRHPTILFWLFLIPLMGIAVAGCYAVLNRRAEQTRVAAVLTGTPTHAATDTSAPGATSTPGPPTGETTPTQYVYDDPSGWEFVERTDPAGTTYLDLQDWQREQVWHAFEEFWNLRYRAEHGMTPIEQILPLVTGRYLEGVQYDYDYAAQNGEYVYLVQPLSDLSHAMLLDSAEGGTVRVKVLLVSEVGFALERRETSTGQVLSTNERFPYRTWDFMLTFMDGRWVVEDSTAERLE